MKFEAMRWTLSKLPRAAKRKLLHSIPAQYEMIAVLRGQDRAGARADPQALLGAVRVQIRGQADMLICPVPYISPYNVYSILNPLLVQVMGLGYFHNFYRSKPLLKKGGVMILTHPCYDEFDHNLHPSYIEFFNRLLPETRDAL